MTDMKHLEYLSGIADIDVDEIQRKEQTYRGSWKKRGGVGAFMMVARKWDRLEQMAKERQYDMFDRPGEGEDGSMIAEIRDLRRYLLLIEAELQSRGLFYAVPVRDKTIDENAVEIAEKLGYDFKQAPKPNPGNGSQHESLYPWVVNVETAAQYPDWYRRVDSDKYVLETFVGISEGIPSHSIKGMYHHVLGGWLINIAYCPPGAREYFPTLQTELNDKERSDKPDWQKNLYMWTDDADKYVLAKEWRSDG